MNIDEFAVVRPSFEKDKLEKKLAAALEVVEAVRYCGARIETIGHGFDARNVYVVDLKLMEKIGDALQKFDKASEKHSKEKE